MKKYQEEVANITTEFEIKLPPTATIEYLKSQLSDLSQYILEVSNYGSDEIDEKSELEDRIGNIQFALLSLSDELKIDLDDATKATLDRYKNLY